MTMRPRPEKTGSSAASHYAGGEEMRYTQQNESLQFELAASCMALLHAHVDLESSMQGRRHGSIFLDLGCGSGLSSRALVAAGHAVIGIDIAREMLTLQDPGFLVESDLAEGLPLRTNSCDGAISVSVLQWLAPRAQQVLFESLSRALRPGGCAVFQFYPAPSDAQASVDAAATAGLHARLVISMPHATRARKLFLCTRRAPTLLPCSDPPVASTVVPVASINATIVRSDADLSSRNLCAHSHRGHCPLAWPMPATCPCGLYGDLVGHAIVPVFPTQPQHPQFARCDNSTSLASGGWPQRLLDRCAHQQPMEQRASSGMAIDASSSELHRIQHHHLKHVRRVHHALEALTTGSTGATSGDRDEAGAALVGAVSYEGVDGAMSALACHAVPGMTDSALSLQGAALSALLYVRGARGGGCEDAMLVQLVGGVVFAVERLCETVSTALPTMGLVLERADVAANAPSSHLRAEFQPRVAFRLAMRGAACPPIAAACLESKTDMSLEAAAQACSNTLVRVCDVLEQRGLVACALRCWVLPRTSSGASGSSDRTWMFRCHVAFRRRLAAANAASSQVLPSIHGNDDHVISGLDETSRKKGKRKRGKKAEAFANDMWAEDDCRALLEEDLGACLQGCV